MLREENDVMSGYVSPEAIDYNIYNDEGKHPNSKWHDWWLSNRLPQLFNNMKVSGDKTSQFYSYMASLPGGERHTFICRAMAEAEKIRQIANLQKHREYNFNADDFIENEDLLEVGLLGYASIASNKEQPIWKILPEECESLVNFYGYYDNDSYSLLKKLGRLPIALRAEIACDSFSLLYGGYKIINDFVIKYSTQKNNILPTNTTSTHERTHGLDAKPQEAAIENIISADTNIKDNRDKYLDKPGEIYARMMELRHYLKLNPLMPVSMPMIVQWRKNLILQKFSLDRYTNQTLYRLFNEIAQNTQRPANQVQLAESDIKEIVSEVIRRLHL